MAKKIRRCTPAVSYSLAILCGAGGASADTVVDTLPANNQANLTADAGQTFTTGVLTEATLSRIEIEGPQTGTALLGPFTLELYADGDGDHGTWDPGALLGRSTSSTLVAGGATLTAFDFPTLPVLSNNTVYAFSYTDGAGTRVDARMGLTDATAIADGTLFSAGGQVFGDAFDTAMRIITGGPLGSIDLTVDRSTGDITLTNTTGAPLADIIGYSILSDAGALTQNGWNQQAAGPSQLASDNDDWTVLSAAGDTLELSEAVLTTSGDGDGGDLAANSGVWSFGPVWRKSHVEDVAMELLLDDGTILNSGTDFNIVYSGDLIDPADLDGNGAVNPLDWVSFKNAYGSEVAGMTQFDAYHNGDVNLDGVSNQQDFVVYRQLYDAANGPGALAAAIAQIPEPASLLLAAFGCLLGLGRKSLGRLRSHAVLAGFALLIVASQAAEAEILVPLFEDDFEAYEAADPADFSPTGNWTHNGAGTDPNASRIFDTVNFGGTRLWIASADNAAAGSGIDGTGIEVDPHMDLTFQAALVAETFDGTRTATGIYDLRIGPSFGAATSVLGGPQSFTARGDAGVADSVDDSYADQLTTQPFNTGAVGAGDKLFISIAFDGADDTNPFVGIDNVSINASAEIGVNVNADTGSVTMFGDPTFDFDITSYSLTSAAGQLVPGGFSSLESQGVGDPAGNPDDGVGFEVLGTPDATEIAEGDLTGATVWNAGTNFSLGSIFNTSTPAGQRDLAITFTTPEGDSLEGTVNYVTGGLPGDADGDNDVDGRDFLLLQRNNPGGIAAWEANYGAGLAATHAAAAVPEPTSVALLMIAGGCAGGWLFRRRKPLAACIAVGMLGAAANVADAAQNDREYTLGDDAAEGAVAGNKVGFSAAAAGTTFDSAGTPGAGDLQDLFVQGDPTYVSVGDRPGAGGSALGARFDGVGDALNTGISMNAPTQMYNNETFFPGPPPAIFPHNYAGIFSHGIQLWAKPDPSALGTTEQTLVRDTAEHGIAITDGGNWSLLFGDGSLDSGVSVAGTLDANGWAHAMELSGFDSPVQGASAFGGALLVNGVAVRAQGTSYAAEATELVIGAGPDGEGGLVNHYHGVLDDVRIFFWGDNSDDLGQDNAPGGANTDTATNNGLNADGRNWGPLDLNVDNDWIANRLSELASSAGVASIPEADLDFDGDVDEADETLFIAGWRSRNLVDGVQVGDWNSRQNGDFNYDGVVDLADAFRTHVALTASGGGLNFALLGATVPEPSSLALSLLAVVGFGSVRRRLG